MDRLLYKGVKLECDNTFSSYYIQEHDVIHVQQEKIYRSIGCHSKKIKTLRIVNEDSHKSPNDFRRSSIPFEYKIVEIVPPLPSINVLLRRGAFAVSYLLLLDR